ncbi:MAG: hypothetical protein K8T25_24330 [Planctomycetia bacterium]|nr:hypothetical protein [Planctomycetia bacterium]
MNTWYLSPILDQYFGTGGYAVVGVLGIALLAAWLASVLFTALPWPRRVALAGLRLGVIVLLIMAMLRPARMTIESRPQPATLLVLLDRSRSMTVKDAFGGHTRWEAMKKAFDDAGPALAKLTGNKSYEVKPYAFDADAVAIEFDGKRIVLGSAPNGDQTAIGMAMQDVVRREGTKRLLGLILASDGAMNTIGASSVLPQSEARALANLNCPIFAVPFGQRTGGGQDADVEVESMPDDLRVFVKNEVTVSGTVRIWGYINRDIPVQLLCEREPGKPEPVAATVLRAVRDGEQLRYELHYTPQEPGEYRLIVRAAVQEGEKATDNNELSTYLTVLPGGLRVLYLEGEARPEQKFLRRALSSSPDINVTLKWIRPTDRTRWPLKSIDGEPIADYFQPGKFDVYVIGDLDSAALTNEDWGLLKQTVLRGAGLLMLGGWHSYWPGGYQNTPLVDIMPIAFDRQLDSTIRQKWETYVPPDYHLEGDQKMRPAEPFGSRHYLMQLAPGGANAEAWRRLPPLDGANRFRGVRQGGIVLAETESGLPLLAAAEPGGRVLCFAGDSTWRWAMHNQDAQHRRFWRQVALWLARKDTVTKGSVGINLDSRRFMPGMAIHFAAGARTAEGTELSGAAYTAQLVLPNGTRRPIMPRQHGDEIEGEITDKLPPGQYTIEVTATSAAAALGTARARFLVYEKDLELTNATADPALMASLADATKAQGGRVVQPEELPKLLAELAARPVDVETKVQVRQTYYDQWYVFVALVGLMSVEWFLRKRWRLV